MASKQPQKPESGLIQTIEALTAEVFGPECRPVRIIVVTSDGYRFSLDVPLRGSGSPVVSGAAADARHSVDFRSVNWFGHAYSFSTKQALCVGVLWEAWQAGTPEVDQKLLLRACGSEGVRLVDLFRDSPAWGRLIIPGNSRGTSRLAEPPRRP